MTNLGQLGGVPAPPKGPGQNGVIVPQNASAAQMQAHAKMKMSQNHARKTTLQRRPIPAASLPVPQSQATNAHLMAQQLQQNSSAGMSAVHHHNQQELRRQDLRKLEQHGLQQRYGKPGVVTSGAPAGINMHTSAALRLLNGDGRVPSQQQQALVSKGLPGGVVTSAQLSRLANGSGGAPGLDVTQLGLMGSMVPKGALNPMGGMGIAGNVNANATLGANDHAQNALLVQQLQQHIPNHTAGGGLQVGDGNLLQRNAMMAGQVGGAVAPPTVVGGMGVSGGVAAGIPGAGGVVAASVAASVGSFGRGTPSVASGLTDQQRAYAPVMGAEDMGVVRAGAGGPPVAGVMGVDGSDGLATERLAPQYKAQRESVETPRGRQR